jgi:hypothetical protein
VVTVEARALEQFILSAEDEAAAIAAVKEATNIFAASHRKVLQIDAREVVDVTEIPS